MKSKTIVAIIIVVILCCLGTVAVALGLKDSNGKDTVPNTEKEKLLMEEIKSFKNEANDGLYAIITTTRGNIFLELYYDKTPMTVCNFVGLADGIFECTKGKHYYDGLKFHRVIANFMIQGGDPEGTGSGGPGYRFPDEFDQDLRHDGPGVLSMANAGADTNGSQFFITHVETPWLNDKHTVFGRVVKGQNVVNAVQQGDTMERVEIYRKGSAAESFEVSDKRFEQLQSESAQVKQAKINAIISSKWPQAKKDETGVYYMITKEGTGNPPAPGQMLTMRYNGALLNGTVFDDSDMHEPLEFECGTSKLIPGFSLQAAKMKLGEKRTIIIPPELGYGSQSVGNGIIPGNSYLVFELELLQIK